MDLKELTLWPASVSGTAETTQDSEPSLTIHFARPEAATGAAMVVCPGGGYRALMLTYEGHDVAEWLARHGVTAAVLRYRIHPFGPEAAIADGMRSHRSRDAHPASDRAARSALEPKPPAGVALSNAQTADHRRHAGQACGPSSHHICMKQERLHQRRPIAPKPPVQPSHDNGQLAPMPRAEERHGNA